MSSNTQNHPFWDSVGDFASLIGLGGGGLPGQVQGGFNLAHRFFPGGGGYTAPTYSTTPPAQDPALTANNVPPGGTHQNEISNTPGGQEDIYYPPGMTPDASLKYTGAGGEPSEADVAYAVNKMGSLYKGKSAADLWTQREQLRNERSDIMGGLVGNYADQKTQGAPFTLDQDMATRNSAVKGYDTKLGEIDKYISAAEKQAAAGSGSGSATGDPVVDAWVSQINSGKATLSNVPSKLRGSVILAMQNATKTIAKDSGVLDNLNLVNQLSTNKALHRISGPLDQVLGGHFGKAATAKNQFDQLVGILSLANRKQLKGSGAISDFESKTLERASSALGRNLSDKEFKKQLGAVRGAFTTAAGLDADVTVTDPATGESKAGSLDRAGIDEAISSGYIVEYQ